MPRKLVARPVPNERRARSRTKGALQWTAADREVLHGLKSLLETRSGDWFGEITPEEHREHHVELQRSAVRRRWFWDHVRDGVGEVLKRLVMLAGIVLVMAVAGSTFSSGVRDWLMSLLRGAIGG